ECERICLNLSLGLYFVLQAAGGPVDEAVARRVDFQYVCPGGLDGRRDGSGFAGGRRTFGRRSARDPDRRRDRRYLVPHFDESAPEMGRATSTKAWAQRRRFDSNPDKWPTIAEPRRKIGAPSCLVDSRF